MKVINLHMKVINLRMIVIPAHDGHKLAHETLKICPVESYTRT